MRESLTLIPVEGLPNTYWSKESSNDAFVEHFIQRHHNQLDRPTVSLYQMEKFAQVARMHGWRVEVEERGHTKVL